MEPKNKKHNFCMIIFPIVGVLISVLNFIIFHHFGHYIITITLCVVDITYAYFNARLYLASKDWNGSRRFFIPLMLLAYWAIIFTIICVGNAMMFEGSFSNAFFLYPIFLMPSFVVVVLLIALIGSGM